MICLKVASSFLSSGELGLQSHTRPPTSSVLTLPQASVPDQAQAPVLSLLVIVGSAWLTHIPVVRIVCPVIKGFSVSSGQWDSCPVRCGNAIWCLAFHLSFCPLSLLGGASLPEKEGIRITCLPIENEACTLKWLVFQRDLCSQCPRSPSPCVTS